MKHAAILSCLGLGDGLIALVLSNNLHLNGSKTTTFHPTLSHLQSWFPHLPIHPFPTNLESTLAQFDQIFLFLESSAWMQKALDLCLKHYRHKTTILNPIATPNQDYPYWEEGRFNGKKTLVDNLYTFSENILRLKVLTKSNGIAIPEHSHLRYRQHTHRVLLHPTSSREGKNWSKEKYLSLAHRLEKAGYQPRFLLSREERLLWELDATQAPILKDLNDIASYIYTSRILIGNDSGMGHLASCLGVPTVTICRNKMSSQFWRPGWARGRVLYPSQWIPNLKGFRLRDQYWKKWISVTDVYTSFQELMPNTENTVLF